jgi:hypothetical protein
VVLDPVEEIFVGFIPFLVNLCIPIILLIFSIVKSFLIVDQSRVHKEREVLSRTWRRRKSQEVEGSLTFKASLPQGQSIVLMKELEAIALLPWQKVGHARVRVLVDGPLLKVIIKLLQIHDIMVVSVELDTRNGTRDVVELMV